MNNIVAFFYMNNTGKELYCLRLFTYFRGELVCFQYILKKILQGSKYMHVL